MINTYRIKVPRWPHLNCWPILCVLLLVACTAAHASAREIEVINYTDRTFDVCYRWTRSTVESGAGGSWTSNSYIVQGWRSIPPRDSHKIRVKGDDFWILIRDARGNYLNYSRLHKDVHFIHPRRVFNNIVTGGSSNGKDKGKLQAGNGHWIKYGSNGHSPDRPIQFGFERRYFYKWPRTSSRIELR